MVRSRAEGEVDMIDQDSDTKNLRADLTTSAVEAARRELMELALDIHAHPELNYQADTVNRLRLDIVFQD